MRLIRAEGDSPKSWHLFAYHFSENACGQMQLDALMMIQMLSLTVTTNMCGTS